MTRRSVAVLVGAIAACVTGEMSAAANAAAQESYWPSDEWRTASPESQGIDSDALATMLEFVESEGLDLHSLQVVRNGYLVLDAFFYPYSGRTRHDLASVTKSITSILIGIAIDRGHIESAEASVGDFFPELDAERRESIGRVTIAQMLSMSSGLKCGYGPGEPELFAMIAAEDWVDFALKLPGHVESGTAFAYCSGNNHILSAILTRATGMTADEFAREYLFEPLGIEDTFWPRDPQGITHGWGDLQLHPHAMARIGYLYSQGGVWDGERVVSSDWIESSTRSQIDVPGPEGAYGYGWWLNEGILAGIFEARGRGGQRVTVWPAQELVVVITAGGVNLAVLVPYLMAALRANAPLPENTDALSRLHKRVAAATVPPELQPIGPLPPRADGVSGRTYAMAPNTLGLESVSLRFTAAAAEALLSIELAGTASRPGGTFELLVGLDGEYRISESGPGNLPVGVRGKWEPDGSFVMRYTEVAGATNFTLRMTFDTGGDADDADDGLETVSLQVQDPTGYFGQTISGRATGGR